MSHRSTIKLPIQVWVFEDAPAKYRKLSTSGGDEDWLALVPEHYMNLWIGWAQNPNSSFGICDTQEHIVTEGKVLIGSHA